MPEGPRVELRGIDKAFGGGPLVLEDISIQAEPGEIIAIVGPSGCGKSTLLRIIAGLLPAERGTVRLEGGRSDLAFIFQEATLLPWATVEDNIALPLRLQGMPRGGRCEMAREWARRLGLQDALRYYPRQLSGGMKMRVSIARALVTRPGLLLLDEPFASLDAITRNRLNEELRALRREAGWTAFVVTHSVSEAVFLSDRMVFLSSHPGRITAILDNPLPLDRDAHTRESLPFQQILAEATAALHNALNDEPAPSSR